MWFEDRKSIWFKHTFEVLQGFTVILMFHKKFILVSFHDMVPWHSWLPVHVYLADGKLSYFLNRTLYLSTWLRSGCHFQCRVVWTDNKPANKRTIQVPLMSIKFTWVIKWQSDQEDSFVANWIPCNTVHIIEHMDTFTMLILNVGKFVIIILKLL